MIYSETEILRYIEENDVKFVKLTFCDINGNLKNISVLSSELSAVFAHGSRITASKITGFSIAGGRDLFLFPDPRTMTVLPWRPQQGRVIRMFCYIRYADGTAFEGDGRYFLKTAMKTAISKGWCTRFGTSSEFCLFRTDEKGKPTRTPHDYAGYCDTAPEDRGENIRRDVCITLEQMGIHPISSRHESGNGQHEIDFNSASALQSADYFLSFKSAVKSVARQHGVHASFMPKPVRNDHGNGMHISFNIFRDSDFFNNDVQQNGAPTYSAAAGIMKYIREFMIFTNSTVNSYNRLGEFSAPRAVMWGMSENNQLIRIDDASSPFVLRVADCACNPYFVFGLMIYAALDGIANNLELPPENTCSGESLPVNIYDASKLAENSDFIKKYIPEEILSYILEERRREWKEYSSAYDKESFEENKYFYTL
ncbi:MAG: glutamine synthetase family protein [Prevotella sp.]|nr:glutamine synthetase family protein [Alistipes senegalensis]MCM1357790.1 glutamine synthetase family protein [Prevotella sp.]MCM1474471.1 glutamine synthetase family protein [Muribaculaceae bacterium]